MIVRFIRPTPQWPSLNSKCTVKCNQLTDEGGNRLCGYARLLDERIAWAERRYHTSLSRLFRCVDVAQIYFYTQQPELMLFTLVTFVLFFPFLFFFLLRFITQHLDKITHRGTVAKEIFFFPQNVSPSSKRNYKRVNESIESGKARRDRRHTRQGHRHFMGRRNSFTHPKIFCVIK